MTGSDRRAAPASTPSPPAAEAALGLRAYLTRTPGIGGRLRTEPEDFAVIELGPGPPRGDGPHAAARIRLRNWETNRFAARAARELGVKRGQVSFAGMKDKRAVTEQWFTFRCPLDRVAALERLQDVAVLEAYPTAHRSHAGAHAGNRFLLRVRDHHADADAVAATMQAIQAEGGVPNLFGPQRFGGGFRPVTHLVGKAIVAGDLEEAVRIYLGNPVEGERDEALKARRVYEETRDPAAALDAYPHALDPERMMLKRLLRRPGDWRNSLRALPPNLLQLFVHAWQSYLFNRVLSARLKEGMGLGAALVGDRVLAEGDDGTRTVPVTPANLQRVQRELDRGRAASTAPLVGHATPLGDGEPGRLERRILEEESVDPDAFRCPQLPETASAGRRRGILQPVGGLKLTWIEGDPVFGFNLGRGAYATVVMREFMKAPADAY